MTENGKLQVRSLAQFLALQFPEVSYIVEPVVAVGGSMFMYGPAESYKSWLALDLAFAIAAGTDWLTYKTSKKRVLLVQTEQVEPAYQERVMAYTRTHGTAPEGLYFTTDTALKLDDFYGQAQLEVAVNECKPDIVMLDCLYKVLSGSVSDETIAKKFLDGISKMQRDRKTAWLIVHHPRKHKTDDGKEVDEGFEEMMGHSVFNFWADSILKVQHAIKSEHILLLRWQKARNAKSAMEDVHVKVDPATLGFSLKGVA